MAVLREWGVPIAAIVPEPNTWRELLELLDEKRDIIPLKGRSVVVQIWSLQSRTAGGVGGTWRAGYADSRL